MDMLATSAQLALLMQDTGLDSDTATLLLELATAEVQAICQQRLVAVADDTATLIGGRGVLLELPERPVTAVTSVTIDGTAVIDWTWPGEARWLHRPCGWLSTTSYSAGMSTVAVVYDHGYADGSQDLGLAMSATLGLARDAAVNPSGVQSESIDDYRVMYTVRVAAAADAATGALRNALRNKYAGGIGKVRIAA